MVLLSDILAGEPGPGLGGLGSFTALGNRPLCVCVCVFVMGFREQQKDGHHQQPSFPSHSSVGARLELDLTQNRKYLGLKRIRCLEISIGSLYCLQY